MMMRRLVISILFLFLFIPLQAKKERVQIPERYKKWVGEEVVYIITPNEKDVFLKLETDREREVFIEAFWKQRDPTYGTPRNEFKEEHYQRLQYANEFFGRGTPRPGWMTDQGMIYIILGPPKTIDTYDHVMNVHPTEIWSYLGDPKYGLPPVFNIVFFKKEGTGEYILYSPSDHGPQSLIADYMRDAQDTIDAYQRLSKLEPTLAKHSLSLIPGERAVPGLVSLVSSRLFSSIFSSPQKKVNDEYAEAFLRYKDFVEVEYTANYIGSDSMVKVLRDESGFFLVHYTVEPKKLSVDYYDDKYNAHFELNGRISDLNGKTIFQYSKVIPVGLDKNQVEEMRLKSYALQDMFPLVPGKYRFDLLIKNTVSKEFTSVEEDVVVPQETSAPQISALILGYKAQRSLSTSREISPFKVGEIQVLCQPRKIFASKDSLFVCFQLLGLKQELRSEGSFTFNVFRKEEDFFSQTRKISQYEADVDFIEEISLRNFPPDYYKIRISVIDKEGKEILFKTEDFEITHVPDLPRPLVVSRIMPASRLEEYTYTLGVQRLNQGKIKEAKSLIGEAYHKDPGQLKYALGYSQALFINQEYQKVKEVLMLFVDDQEARVEILYFLGKASHSLRQYEEALSYYRGYLSHFGTNLEILNLMGTCHYQLGNKEEALKIWRKSLEVNPDQENIKKLVQSLQEKK